MTLFLSLPFPPLRCESRPFDIWTVGRLRQMRSTNHASPSKAHLRLASLDLRHFIDIFLKGQPLHDYSVVWAFLFTVSVEQTLARGNLLRGELWLRHSGVVFTTDHWPLNITPSLQLPWDHPPSARKCWVQGVNKCGYNFVRLWISK